MDNFITLFFLIIPVVILAVIPYLNDNNFSNIVTAEEYDNYGDDMYSKYATEENKYECQKGPFEGFFVSSVEFCKHLKFEDNRKDNQSGTQGPPGPTDATGP